METKLWGLRLNWKLLIKCHPAGPVWTGSLGPAGCRTCLKIEAITLKENRHNLEWCFPLWSPLCALSSLPYRWLCGFRFVQFIETNHSRLPWNQLLYFHSCSLSSPVGRRPQHTKQSPRPTVEISVFVSFNPTYGVWLEFFFSNL